MYHVATCCYMQYIRMREIFPSLLGILCFFYIFAAKTGNV